MAKKKKGSKLPIILVLILIPLLILGGIVFGIYSAYNNKKTELIKAICELPAFSEEETSKEVAKELKLKYPPEKPIKPYKKVREEITKKVKEKVGHKYSSKSYSRKLQSIIKKYSPARKGQEISYQTITSNSIRKGIYKGKVKEGRLGYFVMIGKDKKYSIRDIQPEFHYLFSDTASKVVTNEKVKEFKDSFNDEKKDYLKKCLKKYENKLFSENGFITNDQHKWVTKDELIQEKVELKKKFYIKNRKKDIRKIKRDYRFLWVIPIPVSEEEINQYKEETGNNEDESEDLEDAEDPEDTE